MTGRLEGKVALITGAARGQGEAEARRFVAEGASVLLTDVLDEQGEAVAASLGDAAAYRHLDVTSEEDWVAAVADAEERFGPVSVLVNNAGILDFSPVHKQDMARFRLVLEVNLVGTMIGMKTVAPSMKRAGGGSIINISSNAGIVGIPTGSAYVASKWAVRGLSKTAALDLGRIGVRVNSVHPGGIDTPMTDFGTGESGWAKALPMGRMGKPDEVANVVAFLASDEA
ncbi:MAG: SDR family NAD(P)-dependent oxidoreductase, partial [Acidimicrobiales bacterium]